MAELSGSGVPDRLNEAEEVLARNTDRELFREDTGDPAGSYYENSVFVTESGTIGMSVGGRVVVMPIASWHVLAWDAAQYTDALAKLRANDPTGQA